MAGLTVVFSPDIIAEWRRHRSKYAGLWLTTMYGRKQVANVVPREQVPVRSAIDQCNKRLAEILRKDLPLVETALATDQRIVSRDAEAREGFAGLPGRLKALHRVQWASPLDRGCEEWLRGGAPENEGFALGHRGQ
jgi:hypothetical protein